MKRIEPVVPVNEVASLLEGMGRTGFQGRKLGESLDVWTQMIEDESCTIMLGLSGAMIPAGMQECIKELVKKRYVDVIVSTGANMFHDACEHLGIHHYRGYHHVDDAELYSKGIDRIYDVFAYEEEFRSVDTAISEFADALAPYNSSSRDLTFRLGKWLSEKNPSESSVLSECAANDVPVFIPALCDSSIGIGLLMARRRGIDVSVDQIADTDEITGIVESSKRTGVIYVGGGVPKNFIQQTQVIASIHDGGNDGHHYAIQYTTDAPHWGGLSGCTFEEAISWGKEKPGCRNVQCFCDATISVPVVVSGLIGRNPVRSNIPDVLGFMK
ncbi:deoxyhypusine synthase [Methanoplanus sp. FWC-SCC4]|uniref:Deoxyhypusine synthase n=1 Tax=Methanochimaera problematica TaxID=2609417 RepID=A0AA97FFJ5_9EURY|nr:deoxyhypusine synthase [Methanoplanus sp. FWC-SCC4]WOF16521.1 deoxyhypusine synthase [Methanoplanus sp. FWC-SCC4]